jgi:tetratricopeptide (TPR) repeat protein
MRKSVLALVLSAASLAAQNPNQIQSLVIQLPEASQRAVAGQRLAMTDVTIVYHRPLTHGRKIFGSPLAPYGQVWRAGANENTTIEFSSNVTVEGQPLAKGIYGLHMIPGENEWTIIFSKNASAWGSFFYDQKEDALRVSVKPATAEMREALSYEFDDLKQDSARVTMRWETTAISFRVAVNLVETTMASLRDQLRGLHGFVWASFNDAATWCLENKTNYDDALRWTDRSIQIEERFENLETKSQVLTRLGRNDEAKTFLAKALDKGTVLQLHTYGRQLQIRGQAKEGLELFRQNAKKNPGVWIVHVGLARVHSAAKEFDAAAAEMRKAIEGAPNPQQKTALDNLLKRLEAKQDIN